MELPAEVSQEVEALFDDAHVRVLEDAYLSLFCTLFQVGFEFVPYPLLLLDGELLATSLIVFQDRPSHP